jgi:segregation and condensation protein A
MAAMLIEIKARMLLPVKKSDSGQEAEDPRAELVRRLLEYEQIKLAAQKLDALPQLGRDFQRSQAFADLRVERALPEVSVEDLRQAWVDILKRAKLNAHHHITREQLSVRDHMTHILRRLNGVRFIEFGALFMERISEGAPTAVVVVHFLALLELARETLLEITQAEPYAPIYVRLAYTSAAV